MTLTPFEWALVVCLAVFAWFLIRRDFQSRDALAATVQKLAEEVAKLHTHLAEHYVNKVDHLREVERLEDNIEEHAQRWREELAQHRTECPARCS